MILDASQIYVEKRSLSFDSTDRLHEMHTRGREGVYKVRISAYVLNGCALTTLYRDRLKSVCKDW